MTLFIKQQGHSGEPLILLHGWGFNSGIWETLAAKLAQTWQVYQVDLPGHGRSPLSEYSLSAITRQFADHLPTNAVWMGWSLGGLLAQAMALNYPHSVKTLILISTSPRFITADDWTNAMSPQVLAQFAQQLQQDTVGTLKRFLALQVKDSAMARQELRALYAILQECGYPQPEALKASLQLLQTTDLRDRLQNIQCPALLCLGGRDTLVPVGVGADCQHLWKRLRKVCIKPAGHLPFLSHPEAFMYLLQGFLNDLSTS